MAHTELDLKTLATVLEYPRCFGTTGLVKNLAMSFICPDFVAIGTRVHVEVIGQVIPAKFVPRCLYEPENTRIRSKPSGVARNYLPL